MRAWSAAIGFLFCLGTQAGPGDGAPPRFLNSRDVVIRFTPGRAPVTQVELFVTDNGGRTWEWAAHDRLDDRSLRYTADGDGAFGFYLVLHNDAGSSASPPAAGTSPQVEVTIDTLPPLLQVRDTQVENADGPSPAVLLYGTLLEENLAPDGVRVFLRTADGRWRDGGPAIVEDGLIRWQPATLPDEVVDLSVAATDRAGNCARQIVHNVSVPSAPRAQDVFGPPADHVEPLAGEAAEGIAPVAIPAVEPVAPVRPPALSGQGIREAADMEGSPDSVQVAHLRSLAAQLMREGRYPTAAARYDDALKLAPRDGDLLVGLGSALYRCARYDDAYARFEEALRLAPDDPAALEGLALVAATQRRYPLAREHMGRLQALRPDSGLVWLRSGDIDHRLGDPTAAVSAWQKALELAGADESLREMARRRLEYFDRDRNRNGASETWPSPARPRSSSSSATNRTGS